MKKIIAVGICSILFAGEAGGWGFYAHRMINQHAVFLLPPEMVAFYKQHLHYIMEHSVDPDKRRYAVTEEGPRHYIDMDRYDMRLFAKHNVDWKRARVLYPEDTLKAYGIVPWWIQTVQARLTEAFRARNVSRILRLSAELGHYVGDAHVPLHATSNHNGQLTGQDGIHAFWESRIPELLAEKEWDFWIGHAEYIRRPLVFTWKRVLESASAADSVLRLEKLLSSRFPVEAKYAYSQRNGVLTKQYSEAYTAEYDRMMNGMVEQRFRESVYAVASFWYTAWVNAGQPNLRELAKAGYIETDSAEAEDLNRKWREGLIRGKECD